MAKHSISKSGGTSRFRMVVINAELQEGEISQLAQVIQGAFGGGQRVTMLRHNGSAVKSLSSPDPDEVPAELDGAEVLEEDRAAMTASAPTKPRAQRKMRTP